jgi:hypothetical protein
MRTKTSLNDNVLHRLSRHMDAKGTLGNRSSGLPRRSSPHRKTSGSITHFLNTCSDTPSDKEMGGINIILIQ